MVKDPYKVLEASSDTPYEQLEKKYNELKALYGEQRFKSGEEGNEGARKLSELEEAWQMIVADFDKRTTAEEFSGNEFGRVDELIKKGSYDEAQAILDAMTDRGGEWHYFQSIIFYKRDWLSECKKQLEMAVECDPTNTKYKTSLEKLNMVMGNMNVNPGTLGDTTGQGNPNPNAAMGSNCLANCCCAYIFSECCCTMMRCC